MSIQRWNFCGIKDDSGQIVNYDDHLAEMQRVKDALELQLADARKASDWQEITPDNMPGFDDEIGRYHPHSAGYWFETSSDFVSHKFEDYVAFGWTHFRPINPPAPKAGE